MSIRSSASKEVPYASMRTVAPIGEPVQAADRESLETCKAERRRIAAIGELEGRTPSMRYAASGVGGALAGFDDVEHADLGEARHVRHRHVQDERRPAARP